MSVSDTRRRIAARLSLSAGNAPVSANAGLVAGLSIEIIGYRYEENTISESLNLK